MNIVEMILIVSVFSNKHSGLVLLENELAWTTGFVGMRALVHRLYCHVFGLSRQNVNLLELLKSVRVIVDKCVYQTTIQLTWIHDVKRVARKCGERLS